MDAAPRLVEIADAFAAAQLEAILIGNAGAALHGAPVTTLDFGFLYRPSPANETKLRKVAELLGGQITQPLPTVSTVFRILRADTQLQIDLTSQVHGVKSFNTLRSKAARVEINGRTILVAALADIIKNKREARAIPALMEAFWKPERPAPYWADCKLRLSQLRAPSMHALVVDLAEALSPLPLSRHCSGSLQTSRIGPLLRQDLL